MSNNFRGALAQIALYPTALSAQQVGDHWAAANAESIPAFPTIAESVVTMPTGSSMTAGHPNWTDGVFRLRWQMPESSLGRGGFTVQFGSSDVEFDVTDNGVCVANLGVAGVWAQTQSFTVSSTVWYWLILTNQGTSSSYLIVADLSGAPDTTTIVSGSGVFNNRPPRPIQIVCTEGPVLLGGDYPQVCTVYPAMLPADWLMNNAYGWNQLEPAFCWDSTDSHSGAQSLSISSGAGGYSYWNTQSPDEWDSVPVTAGMPYRFTGWIKVMGDTVGPIYQSVILGTSGLQSYYRFNDQDISHIEDLGYRSSDGSGSGLVAFAPGLIAADTLDLAVQPLGGQVALPQQALGAAWSWECWFSADPALATGNRYELINWAGVRLYLDEQNRLAFPPLRSPAPVADGASHHAVLTCEQTHVLLYLDGVQIAEFEPGPASESPLEVLPPETGVSVFGLTPGQEYTFTLTAVNEVGESQTVTMTATPLDLTLPAATVTVGGGTSADNPLTVDELAFYNAVLSADDVSTHYYGGALPDALGSEGAAWFEVSEWAALQPGENTPALVARHVTPGPVATDTWNPVGVGFVSRPDAVYASVRAILAATGTAWFDTVALTPDSAAGAVTNVTPEGGIRVMGPPAQSVFHLAGDNGQHVVPLFFGTYSRSQEGGPQVTHNFDVTQVPLFNVAQPLARTGTIKWRSIQFNAMMLSPATMAAYTALRDLAYATSTPLFFRDGSGRQALVQQSPQGWQLQHEPSNYRRRFDLQNTYLEVPNTVSPYTPYTFVTGRRALVNGTLPPLDLTEEV